MPDIGGVAVSCHQSARSGQTSATTEPMASLQCTAHRRNMNCPGSCRAWLGSGNGPMIHQRWLFVLFTALFVWMPMPANAQDAEERATPTEKRVIRHQPIQLPRDSSFNPDDILQRFQQAHDQTGLQRLAEQLLKNPSFQKMLQSK